MPSHCVSLHEELRPVLQQGVPRPWQQLPHCQLQTITRHMAHISSGLVRNISLCKGKSLSRWLRREDTLLSSAHLAISIWHLHLKLLLVAKEDLQAPTAAQVQQIFQSYGWALVLKCSLAPTDC